MNYTHECEVLRNPGIREGFVRLRGNMGELYFHRMSRYLEHVEEMRNQVVHDLPMSHEYSELKEIVWKRADALARCSF